MQDLTVKDWDFWAPYLEMADNAQELGQDEIKRLEFRLREMPLSLELRAKLAGYYVNFLKDSVALKRTAELGLWLAKNHPYAAYDMFALHQAAFSATQNADLKREFEAAWVENVKQHAASPQVLYNAHRIIGQNKLLGAQDWKKLLDSARAGEAADSRTLYYLAALELILGEAANAMTLLQRAVTDNPALRALAINSKAFDEIKERAEFRTLVRDS